MMQTANASHYEPFLIEVTEADPPYIDAPLTKVVECDRGWEVCADGWTTFLPYLPYKTWGIGREDRDQPAPKVGDRFRCYGEFGREIHGMQVNDHVVFYRDAAMRAARHRRNLEDYEAQKKRRFTVERIRLDKDYESLPDFFKARIDRFRSENPAFRYDSEGYEMFCCVEAVKIAVHLEGTALGVEVTKDKTREDIINEVVRHFHDTWGGEQNQTEEVVSGAHSVNTFDGACSLAAAYLKHQAGLEVSV